MADEPSAPPPPCNFFRRPSSSSKNIRKRPSRNDDEDDGDERSREESAIPGKTLDLTKPRKNLKSSPLSSSTSTTTSFHFESSKEIQVHHDSRATASLETETPFDRDARAIRERVLRQADLSLQSSATTASDDNPSNPTSSSSSKIYRGIHGYTDYKAGFRREQTVASEKAGGAHGPLRASAHIRASARFDYQPDICKDYKETGYCGYGDACKFMHDRGDYKSGWQLEKEWQEAEKARKRKLAMGAGAGEEDDDDDDGGDSDSDDELPFACFICRQPFEDPVVTKCKHYFCEHCALKHHSKNKKCFVCNQPTLGIFNAAQEIRKKCSPKSRFRPNRE